MADGLGRVAASCLALSLLLAGCSSSKPHAKRSSSSSSSQVAPSTSISLPPLPITPLPSSPTPSTAAERVATDALLTASQLPGFQELPWTLTPVPQPCLAAGTKPVFTQAPPKTLVGRQFSLASPQGVLNEQLAVYAKPADAIAASNLAAAGLACAQGNFYQSDGSAQPVMIAGPADLSSVVGGDAQSASSWTLQNEELTETLLLVVDDQVLIMLSFVAPSKSDLAKLPDGEMIAQLAVSDVQTAHLAVPASTSSSPKPKSSTSSRR